MRVARVITALGFVIILASCVSKSDNDNVIHFSLNEAKNTVTGMTFSKIEIASSNEDCEGIRHRATQGIEEQEFFEIINSVCVSELPSRLSEPFSGKPRYLELVLKYTREGISNTEVFYGVDESWSDKQACEVLGGLYKIVDSHVACYSHQVSSNHFDKYQQSEFVPTIELITLENEQRMLSEELRR